MEIARTCSTAFLLESKIFLSNLYFQNPSMKRFLLQMIHHIHISLRFSTKRSCFTISLYSLLRSCFLYYSTYSKNISDRWKELIE